MRTVRLEGLRGFALLIASAQPMREPTDGRPPRVPFPGLQVGRRSAVVGKRTQKASGCHLAIALSHELTASESNRNAVCPLGPRGVTAPVLAIATQLAVPHGGKSSVST